MQANINAITTQFGRGATILRARPGQFLTNEAISQGCPAVFADEAHDSRSEKYTFIPTQNLLAGFTKAGFFPVEVKQGGSRDLTKRGFTKHMIKFQRADWLEKVGKQVGDHTPEVTLLNSHDGSSTYWLNLGILKLACLNGLLVSDNVYSGIKVPHRGDVLGEVIDAAYTVCDESEKTLPMIEDMRRVGLSQGEQNAFAAAAIELRFEEEAAVQPRQVLQAHRYADEGHDLWKVFNRVQENVVRGGITYNTRGSDGRIKNRHSRPVQGIDQDVRLNKALWRLAEEMRKLKQAA